MRFWLENESVQLNLNAEADRGQVDALQDSSMTFACGQREKI